MRSLLISPVENEEGIKIWNLNTGKLKAILTGQTGEVLSIAISPDGQTLVSGNRDDKTAKIRNLKIAELISILPRQANNKTMDGYPLGLHSVAISQDGQTIVTGSLDSTIKFWDLKTGKLKSVLIGHTRPVKSVAISSDGQTIVSGSWDETIKVWQTP